MRLIVVEGVTCTGKSAACDFPLARTTSTQIVNPTFLPWFMRNDQHFDDILRECRRVWLRRPYGRPVVLDRSDMTTYIYPILFELLKCNDPTQHWTATQAAEGERRILITMAQWMQSSPFAHLLESGECRVDIVVPSYEHWAIIWKRLIERNSPASGDSWIRDNIGPAYIAAQCSLFTAAFSYLRHHGLPVQLVTAAVYQPPDSEYEYSALEWHPIRDQMYLQPVRHHEDDAGFDLKAAYETTIEPGKCATVATGVALRGPVGTYIRLADRSSVASQCQLHVLGGVIDHGYTGEVKVMLVNLSDIQQTIQAGTKICQAIVSQLACVNSLKYRDTLWASSDGRNTSAFGSTDHQ